MTFKADGTVNIILSASEDHRFDVVWPARAVRLLAEQMTGALTKGNLQGYSQRPSATTVDGFAEAMWHWARGRTTSW